MNDTISRQTAIDVVNSETVSTNPEHFKSSEKFIKFMDDTDIASFGKWQWANGFNTALVATTVQLKKLPSAERHGKWIPVTERLPETEDMYLVTRFNERPMLDVAWFYIDEEGLGHFSCDLGDVDSVTAWMMPLPHPYKDGEKG